MTSLVELQQKWESRRADAERLGSVMNGALICADILADLHALELHADAETASLADAAKLCDYHPNSLSRLVKAGRLTNYGTKARPKVRVSDLPRKAKPETPRPVAVVAAGPLSSRGGNDALALDAVASRLGRSRSA